MWKPVLLVLVLVPAVQTDDERPLLKDYRGKEPVPDALYETYAKLTEAMTTGDEGDIQRLCLPRSVTFTREARPARSHEYGQDMNLPYLKSGFSKNILGVEAREDGCYLIRTATSALYFVQTKGGDWKLYRSFDKPIE